MTKEKVENCKEEMAYDYDLQNELGELALVLDGISDLQAEMCIRDRILTSSIPNEIGRRSSGSNPLLIAR